MLFLLDGIAMGYNYEALDSFEFEKLARDVTEKIVGIKVPSRFFRKLF